MLVAEPCVYLSFCLSVCLCVCAYRFQQTQQYTKSSIAYTFNPLPVLADAIFDLDASAQQDGKVVDSIAKMEFNDMATKVDADNVKYFDLSQSSNSVLERQGGGSLTEGRYYTHAYVLKWKASDATWRTLFRHSKDHCALVNKKSARLGVYSNRNSAGFRDSGYDLSLIHI